jgi:hypothetical protein
MVTLIPIRHCEPTGRANARPMTGSAKQSSIWDRKEWIASSQVLPCANASRLSQAMTTDGELRNESEKPA